MKMHNEMMAIRDSLIDPGKIQERESPEESHEEPEIKQEIGVPQNTTARSEDLARLRITVDYMPIKLQCENPLYCYG